MASWHKNILYTDSTFVYIQSLMYVAVLLICKMAFLIKAFVSLWNNCFCCLLEFWILKHLTQSSC